MTLRLPGAICVISVMKMKREYFLVEFPVFTYTHSIEHSTRSITAEVMVEDDKQWVVNKACAGAASVIYYDIGHAPADHSNRRRTPKGYAVWEIHPVMKMEVIP